MLKRLIKFTVLGFFTGAVLSLPLTFILFGEKGWVVSLIIGGVMGLLSLGLMPRVLEQTSYTITSQNKKSSTPMSWYEEQIRDQLKAFRYFDHEVIDGKEVYKSRSLLSVFEKEVILEITPYHISVTGSRLFCRVLKDLVEKGLNN